METRLPIIITYRTHWIIIHYSMHLMRIFHQNISTNISKKVSNTFWRPTNAKYTKHLLFKMIFQTKWDNTHTRRRNHNSYLNEFLNQKQLIKQLPIPFTTHNYKHCLQYHYENINNYCVQKPHTMIDLPTAEPEINLNSITNTPSNLLKQNLYMFSKSIL